jgi:HEAT repeat protein
MIGITVGLPTDLCSQASAQDESGARAPAEAESLRQRAMQVLLEAIDSENPFVRANVVEAMQEDPPRALPLTQRALRDEHPAVRFAAVVTAGMLDLRTLAPAIEPLLNDPNASVRAAALYALHCLDQQVDITPLASLLTSRNPNVRANTAMLLGLLGDESAIPMLQAAARVPLPRRTSGERAAVVRTQIAEAVVRLGDESELDVLRAGVFSELGEVRVVSINALGEVGDERMAVALQGLLISQPPEPAEIRLATAATLARLGREGGLPVAMTFAEHESPVLRAQAAWALGWFSDEPSLQQLVQMLNDPVQQVRVTAAAGVLRRTGTK